MGPFFFFTCHHFWKRTKTEEAETARDRNLLLFDFEDAFFFSAVITYSSSLLIVILYICFLAQFVFFPTNGTGVAVLLLGVILRLSSEVNYLSDCIYTETH